MFRPIFIACGTPFCQAARAQSNVTLYGSLDVGIVYVDHSSPALDVAARKILQMVSSSESRWGLSDTATYTPPHINGLVLAGVYAPSNQASSAGVAGFAKDRADTFGAQYQYGPLVAAASSLEINQPPAGNAGDNNQSGVGAAHYVTLRNIFPSPVIPQQAAAGGANYTREPFAAGLVYSQVKLFYTDRTSLRLSNYAANGRYRSTAEWQAGVECIYTDGYADGGNSFGKFALGNRPKWEQLNLGLDYTLSKRISLYGFFVWQEATGDATQAAIFISSSRFGRRTAANSAPRLKCAHDSSYRLPLNQRNAEVIDPNNSLGVFGAWDIET